jgi:hypothetical protein
MQKSWLKISLLAFLLVLTWIGWGNRTVWASSDQSPERQTVPTRVITDTPGPTSIPPTTAPTNTPAVIGPTSAPPTNTVVPVSSPTASPTATSTVTLTATPTETQTATLTPTPSQTKSAKTATQPPAKTESVVPTMTSTKAPFHLPSFAICGNILILAIIGLAVILFVVLAFVLRRKNSHSTNAKTPEKQ